jgi:DNA-binding CsgD family transcriptional regulator
MTQLVVSREMNMPRPNAPRGRRRECERLERLLDAVRSGESRTLVIRGERGVGKTVLIEYLRAHASGCRIVRAPGVESETELPFAALHQLCGPLLDRLDELPAPQREALSRAFGLSHGVAPDRFLVGLAVLNLLSESAREQPLICVIDDAQWLDQESEQALGFVARRLGAEALALVLVIREPSSELAGLPELRLDGLDGDEARALLESVIHGPLDSQVRDRIVAEARGNPLALLELPRGLAPAELAGGFGLPVALPLSGRNEESFRRRIEQLPADTKRLLLIAAAEPVGDPMLLWRAAERLRVRPTAAAAETEGLLAVGERVRFRHPLMRSAVYRSAAVEDRRAVHLALAKATDREADPDRRAWHLAMAAAGPDEQVALELERSADRAQARGGLAAAAAFLQRAVALTEDPVRRVNRALAAAQASFQAGAFDAALGLVATAEAGPLDEFQRARVELLRAHVAFAVSLGKDAPELLLKAARRLESFDLDLARETYLAAWGAAGLAEDLTARDVLPEICRAVRALPSPPGGPRPLDLLLDGLALLVTEEHPVATPKLQQAAKVLAEIPAEDALQLGWAATGANIAVWDDEGFSAIAARQVELARDAGVLAQLPIHLSALALARAWTGDFAGAASLVAESDSVAAATGSRIAPYALLRLWALQGREAEVSAAMANAVNKACPQAHWAAGVLYNGLARYEEAASAARQAASRTFDPWASMWALPELVEAAGRGGDAELARDALERLAETTQRCGTDFGLGIEARCRALLSDGAAADELYREAIERLSRTRLRPELARAHLLYGEWLRRANRRLDARAPLRAAHDEFTSMGMEAFAERARSELVATGETVRKRTVETRDDLTAQERQISQLARSGLSNPEIGLRLFLSPRTVEWHLRNVFVKLGIRSRRQLADTLPSPDPQLAA